MDFDIFITEGGKWYTVHIKKLSADKVFEQFEISTKVNCVVVQSNRPLVRSKGLRWKYPTYTIISGAIRYKNTFEKITHEITIAMECGPLEPPIPKPLPDFESQIWGLGYRSPKKEKGEEDKDFELRNERHKEAFIQRNLDLLNRII